MILNKDSITLKIISHCIFSLFPSIILIQSKGYNAQENGVVPFYKWELLQSFANWSLFFLFLNLHWRLHGFHFSCVTPFYKSHKISDGISEICSDYCGLHPPPRLWAYLRENYLQKDAGVTILSHSLDILLVTTVLMLSS